MTDTFLRFLATEQAQVESAAQSAGIGIKCEDGVFRGQGWVFVGQLYNQQGQSDGYLHVNIRTDLDTSALDQWKIPKPANPKSVFAGD